MNVKDTQKLEKEFGNAWESASGVKSLQIEGCGTRGEKSVRDSKKPACHSDTDGERDYCVQRHQSRCGKPCRSRFPGDNDVTVGSSCGKMFGKM